jgi:hypothetical protein
MTTDAEIRALLSRLSRRHPSGGTVVERAQIMAEAIDSAAVVSWILEHEGKAEAAVESTSKGGLHSARLSDPIGSEPRPPARYVLPAGTLS